MHVENFWNAKDSIPTFFCGLDVLGVSKTSMSTELYAYYPCSVLENKILERDLLVPPLRCIDGTDIY